MTNTSNIIVLISLAGAAFITLFSCVVMLVNRFEARNKGSQSKKISTVVAVMFFCSSFCWFSMLVYLLHPRVFVFIHPALYLAMLYFEVLLYYIVCCITRTKGDKRFCVWHFLIPLFVVGGIFAGSFFVPFDVQLTIIESHGRVYGDYRLYALLMTSKSFAFFVYNIIYSLLSLRRIRHYRQAIQDYSADEGRSPIRWLYLLFFISLGTLPLVLLGSFLGRNPLFNTIALIFPLMLSVFQDVIICYNVVVVNFKIIESEEALHTSASAPVPLGSKSDVTEKEKRDKKIDKENFERYIRQKKPYLNPDLHITDMATELLTNRTYLSAFINREYAMNFSRYINQLRLKELAKLRVHPDYENLSGMELVQKAGFSNYRGYIRAKNKEDKEATIRME
ncbi:helix-turn-helix transcriptional regulator [Bacteroides sp. 224]|uniref:helix-turn-helix transcriptional regulator n=1 Tax=Bacteroides sp. 224 TaxID=2302936 RepID=UPI0013D2FA1A|nr:helix-turn-helix transcriptional regulator [Bacteroides sp. 224]NDV64478.1 AraC family transcriptional regulator [Bacteroides sp. 224]